MAYAVLGASDPEMEAIEKLLREFGVHISYAAVDGVRVHPGNAYRANGILVDGAPLAAGADVPWWPRQARLCIVECGGPAIDRYRTRDTVADHHRPGDPGHGKDPDGAVGASSLGQVISWLARVGALPATGRAFQCSGPVPAVGTLHYAVPPLGDLVSAGTWHVVVGTSTDDYTSADERGVRSASRMNTWDIPADLVLTAAADHCLGAAYRGHCLGVLPDALLEWRIRERAKFQGRPESEVRGDIETARAELAAADIVRLGEEGPRCTDPDCTCHLDGLPNAKDMRRPEPIPELVEAATRDGVSYISGPLISPDGRRKFTCSGTRDVINAWMTHWAPSNRLVDIYGDPARGFAGGYEEG